MSESHEFTCRLMDDGEEKDVYELILAVFHKCVAPTYSQKGIETFLGLLKSSAVLAVNEHAIMQPTEDSHYADRTGIYIIR